jgi:hypothetical protein
LGGPCHKDRPVFRRSAVVAVEEAAEAAEGGAFLSAAAGGTADAAGETGEGQ